MLLKLEKIFLFTQEFRKYIVCPTYDVSIMIYQQENKPKTNNQTNKQKQKTKQKQKQEKNIKRGQISKMYPI